MRRSIVGAVVAGVAALLPFGTTAGATTSVAASAAGVLHPPLSVLTVRHNQVTSTNWSAYAVQASAKFTKVTGSWVQPSVTCSSGSQYSSFWVGIDGYVSSSVEQLGTDSDCSGSSAAYYAWYEMYPANSVQLSTSSYPVRPGDTLTATVSRSSTSYTLSLSSSRGWRFSIVKTGTHANSSAEWIVESPEICNILGCSLAKLADFGTVNFSASQAADGGSLHPISSFTADGGPHEITMKTSGGTVRAQPSALGSGGQTFSVTWKHA